VITCVDGFPVDATEDCAPAALKFQAMINMPVGIGRRISNVLCLYAGFGFRF